MGCLKVPVMTNISPPPLDILSLQLKQNFNNEFTDFFDNLEKSNGSVSGSFELFVPALMSRDSNVSA